VFLPTSPQFCFVALYRSQKCKCCVHGEGVATKNLLEAAMFSSWFMLLYVMEVMPYVDLDRTSGLSTHRYLDLQPFNPA